MTTSGRGTVLVTGMTIGTVFTLFVVPVVYSLLAGQHKAVPTEPAEPEPQPVAAAGTV